jgi:hypothetical protein
MQEKHNVANKWPEWLIYLYTVKAKKGCDALTKTNGFECTEKRKIFDTKIYQLQNVTTLLVQHYNLSFSIYSITSTDIKLTNISLPKLTCCLHIPFLLLLCYKCVYNNFLNESIIRVYLFIFHTNVNSRRIYNHKLKDKTIMCVCVFRQNAEGRLL